jgi:hypothetical protein
MIGETEKHLPFSVAVPVHTTYQTAFVDDDGRLMLRDDIYRHDAATLAAFAADAKRRDTAREQRAAAAARPADRQPKPVTWLERNLKAARGLLFQR